MKKVLVTGILLATLCLTGCGGPVDNIKDATGTVATSIYRFTECRGY